MDDRSRDPLLLVTKGLDIGGLERIVVDLALAMRARGVPVEVAVVNDRRFALGPSLEDAGVVIHRLGGSDKVGFGGWRRLARLVRDRRFGAVHLHGPLVVVAARLVPGHRPLVSVSHQMWRGLHPLTRAAWRLTGGVDVAAVAVSEAVRESLPKRAARRAQVCPHGVDAAAVALARSIREARMADDATVRAVAVASHRDSKNYPNLLRAVRVARGLGAPVELVAVGDGEGLMRHRALAHELGLADVVEFRPPSPDRWSVMANADVLVVASDYEGHPLVVMEAMALGVPVVATDVGMVRSMVDPASGTVVPPGDARALGAALAGLGALLDGIEPRIVRTLDDSVDQYLALGV